MEEQIPNAWSTLLEDEFCKPYFRKLTSLVEEAYKSNIIYPKQNEVFRAFDLCDPDKIKVVILGQDPYHGANQAHGLAFSVLQDVPIPPSLSNIFKEVKQDVGSAIPLSGSLDRWAYQGVFLLNTVLTVQQDLPGSHKAFGWQSFTDAVIESISCLNDHVCFMLWGKYAQQKASLIDVNKHSILVAPHPSPLSVYKGFIGCKHFSKANAYLSVHSKVPINW